MADDLEQNLVKTLNEKTAISTEVSEWYADRNWLRGLVQIIPYAGGALDTWAGGKAAQHQKQQMEKFIKETARLFASVEEKFVNKQFFDTDEFFSLFRDTLTRAARMHDDEQLKLLSRVLVNSSIGSVDSIVRDSIIDVLGNLKPPHMKVLRTLVEKEPSGHYETISSSGQAIGGFQHASVSLMKQMYPELADLPLQIICDDLARFDLLDWDRVGSFSSNDDVRLGGARGYRPSAFGRTVVAFLTKDAGQLAGTRVTGL